MPRFSLRYIGAAAFFTAAFVFSTVIRAQVPETGSAPTAVETPPSPEVPPPNKPDDAIKTPDEPTDPLDKSVKQQARDWVKAQGWRTGRNKKDKTYISIGVAGYDGDSPRASLNRTLAFQDSLLKAKNTMARFLSADIASRAAASVSQGKSPQAQADDGVPQDVVQQVSAEAKKAGVAGDAIEKGTNRQFDRAVQVLARANVAGSSVVHIIDNGKPGKDGAIAVVVRWSPKTQQIAETAVGARKDKVGSDTAPSINEIDSISEADLQHCFGARVMRNDDNEACIVGFGQGEAIDTGEDEMDVAEEKAQVDAFGNIRQFVGELLLCKQLLSQTSSYARLADGGNPFANSEGFTRECEARASFLNMAGIEEVRAWEGKRSGARPVAGYVGMWSVSASNDAVKLRQEFDKLNAGAGGLGRSNIPVDGSNPGGKATGPGRNTPGLPSGPGQSPKLGSGSPE